MLIKAGLTMKKINYLIKAKCGQTIWANKDYTQM